MTDRALTARDVLPASVLLVACLMLPFGAALGASDLDEFKVKREAVFAFERKPTVTRAGDSVTIAFETKAFCDVTVAIEQADGKIVRHLASGLLGPNAPAPFEKRSKRQTLVWDSRDDTGKLVTTPCNAMVGLGVSARFDRILGWDPWAIRHITALTVDRGGHLYVLSNNVRKHAPTMRVFGRDGRYVRTVLPYPADLSQEELRELGSVTLSDGRTVPFVRPECNYPQTGMFGRQTMCVTDDGRLLLVNGPRQADRYDLRLLVLGTDGHLRGPYLGPLLSPDRRDMTSDGGGVHLALSRDQKTLYISGLRRQEKPHHVVYRLNLEAKGAAEPFLGRLFELGGGEDRLNDPRGVATDAAGNLYVADYGNDRVAVFDQAGKYLGAVEVPHPEQIAVHPATGALYVLSVECPHPDRAWRAAWKEKRLLKLSGWQAGRVLWRLEIPDCPSARPLFALDETATPSLLYVANVREPEDGLWQIRDLGDSFAEPLDLTSRSDGGLLLPGRICVDKERDEVYCARTAYTADYLRLQGEDGKFETLRIPYREVAIGPDGTIHASNLKEMARFSRDLKPLPFSAAGRHVLLSPEKGGQYEWGRARGLWVDGRGYIYHLGYNEDPNIATTRDHAFVYLYVHSPEGRLVGDRVVRLSKGGGGVAVDGTGNIYVADNVKPPERLLPPEFASLAGSSFKAHLAYYYAHYGALYKFPPTGGHIRQVTPRPDKEDSEPDAGGLPVFASGDGSGVYPKYVIEGSLWGYGLISPVPAYSHVNRGQCVCATPRCDVDPFGRVFVPDMLRFSVVVLDSNGNECVQFGSYGNPDSAGPNSRIPKPEIGLNGAAAVAVSERAVYVSDTLNRRIIRVKLDYHATERVRLDGTPDQTSP